MTKIMTDNKIWEKRWFRKLSLEHKLFIKYLWERSSHAGIIDNDPERFAFELGVDIDVDTALSHFGGQIETLDNNTKLYVVDKVRINQGILKEGYNPHIGIITELKKHGLFDIGSKASPSLEQGSLESYSNSNSNSISNSSSNSISKYSKSFLEFYTVYPKKRGKKTAFSAYRRCGVKNDVLIPAVMVQKRSTDWLAGFIPNPATWLNQGRWEDEIETQDDIQKSRSKKYDQMFKS